MAIAYMLEARKKRGSTFIYVMANDVEQIERCMPPNIAFYGVDYDSNRQADNSIVVDRDLEQSIEAQLKRFADDPDLTPEFMEALRSGKRFMSGGQWVALAPKTSRLKYLKLGFTVLVPVCCAYVGNTIATRLGASPVDATVVSIIIIMGVGYAVFR